MHSFQDANENFYETFLQLNFFHTRFFNKEAFFFREGEIIFLTNASRTSRFERITRLNYLFALIELLFPPFRVKSFSIFIRYVCVCHINCDDAHITKKEVESMLPHFKKCAASFFRLEEVLKCCLMLFRLVNTKFIFCCENI